MKLNISLTILIFLLLTQISNAQYFAVIGDYGRDNSAELGVSDLVKSWNPDFIITVGDNNYDYASSDIDQNIGKYYHSYIYPYTGTYGTGATENRFFPCLGNHDLIISNGQAYFDYFTLPNNERYYDFVKGDVHFFAINSESSEPDSITKTSIQAMWLKNKLAQSTSKWKIVYFHESPFSSDIYHCYNILMDWPFKDWGASIVLAGHAHNYERILVNDFPYIINGLGGCSLSSLTAPVAGSEVRYDQNYGAMKVKAIADSITFTFINVSDSLVDEYILRKNTTTTSVNSFTSKSIVTVSNKQSKFQFQIDNDLSQLKTMKVFNLLGQEVPSAFKREAVNKENSEIELSIDGSGLFIIQFSSVLNIPTSYKVWLN